MDHDNLTLLARIDERTKSIEKNINRIENELVSMQAKFNLDITSLKKELKENYITIHQFTPIQRAVFTAISVIVLGVGAALMNLIIPKT